VRQDCGCNLVVAAAAVVVAVGEKAHWIPAQRDIEVHTWFVWFVLGIDVCTVLTVLIER